MSAPDKDKSMGVQPDEMCKSITPGDAMNREPSSGQLRIGITFPSSQNSIYCYIIKEAWLTLFSKLHWQHC